MLIQSWKEKTWQAKINEQDSRSGDSCPNQGIVDAL